MNDTIVVYRSHFEQISQEFWWEFFCNHPWFCMFGIPGLVLALIVLVIKFGKRLP